MLGEGRVLTNAHNVRGGRVRVTVAGGRTAEGAVAGHDADGDLAVIDVDTGGLPALPWASGTPAEIGMPVFALANPGARGRRTPSVVAAANSARRFGRKTTASR